jgi:hypothetical protein
MRAWLRVAAALLLLVAAALCGLASATPPAVRAASAPAGLFSAERAMGKLATIATRPHPTGTQAAGEVREQLVQELTRLGFDVAVQDATSLNERYAAWGYPVVAGHVQNVVARRGGTAGPPAVLLSAHYDSRELAPGASDDGYGTVVLLEAARALSSLPPLRHDIILLFSEGEEQGLLGAKAFATESPLARDVAVAINVDCRGDRGAGVMFQTSDRASDLVETLGRVAPHVIAASLSQEVYRRMPNDTDLTEFLRAGHAGVNLGNIDGFERYHQSTDTLANADPRTVQQLGDDALELARALGDRAVLPVPATHDDVYFNAGPLFVAYDARDALPLGILSIAAVVAAILVARRRGLVTAGGVLAGLGAAVGVPVLAALAALGLVWVATHVTEALTTQTLRDLVRKECLAASLLLGAGIAWAAGTTLARRITPLPLIAGAALLAAMLAVATAAWIPGASFPFLWPALASAAALVFRAMRPGLPQGHPLLAASLLVGPAVACLILTPLAWQVGIAFGVSAGPALAAIAAVAVLVAPACTGVAAQGPQRVVAAALLASGLSLLGVALATPPHDASAPGPDSLIFAIDGDLGRAWWLSVDEHPDRWTGQVLSNDARAALPSIFPRLADRSFLASPAPAPRFRGPEVSITADERSGASRRLRLHLGFAPGTEALEVLVPAAARVSRGLVQGRVFGPVRDGWMDLAFVGPPPDGIDLEVIAADGPIHLTVVAQSRGLPAIPATPITARPADLMPEVGGALRASDMTLVATSVRL